MPWICEPWFFTPWTCPPNFRTMDTPDEGTQIVHKGKHCTQKFCLVFSILWFVAPLHHPTFIFQIIISRPIKCGAIAKTYHCRRCLFELREKWRSRKVFSHGQQKKSGTPLLLDLSPQDLGGIGSPGSIHSWVRVGTSPTEPFAWTRWPILSRCDAPGQKIIIN